jgi:4-hydroxybenzoate polyprenyltransferase
VFIWKIYNDLTRYFRVSDWWNHIVPPILAFTYLSILINNCTLKDSYLNLLFFLLCIFGTAGFGYFLNNVSDIEVDASAGKENTAAILSFWKKYLLLILLLAISIIPLFFIYPRLIIFFLFFFQLILLIVYTLPPLRLKKAIYAGLAIDALYSSVIFSIIGLLLFAGKSLLSNNFVISVFILSVLMFIKGFRNILYHQISDEEYDRKSGFRTFVTQKGQKYTVKLISRVLIPLEIVVIIVLVVFISFTLVKKFYIIIPLYLLYVLISVLLFKVKKNSLWYSELLNNLYADLLPLFIISLSIFFDKWYILLLLIHFFLFRGKPIFILVKKIFYIVLIHYLFHGVIVWLYYKLCCNVYAQKFYRFLGYKKKTS